MIFEKVNHKSFSHKAIIPILKNEKLKFYEIYFETKKNKIIKIEGIISNKVFNKIQKEFNKTLLR